MNKQEQIWQQLKAQAEELSLKEPLLKSYYYVSILNHSSFEKALAHHMAEKLHSEAVPELLLSEVFLQCLEDDKSIAKAALDDIVACFDRDPACDSYCRPFLYFKGYVAVQSYRFAHFLWYSGRRSLARYLHCQASMLFDVDIHPAASVGSGIMLDHATGIVIGETAVVGNNVSMLHGVTLGGSGKESGARHPHIADDVMISCGAKVIGNVNIGECVRIGAGSLVLESVPPHCTVVGVPAKIVGRSEDSPALSMNQNIVD